MTSSRVFPIARAAVRVVSIAVALVVAGRATPARADNVDKLVHQLGDDDSDKVRLSAALNLTKLGDARVSVISALTKALGNDTDEGVRGASAVGLGKLVTDKTAPKVRNAAVDALTQASQSDPSAFVRGEAGKALKAIGVTAQVQTPQAGTAIYVNIGPMAAKTGDPAVDARLKALMVKVANQTMTQVASTMAITWPGGAPPTQAALAAKSTIGFYVDGTVNELKMKPAGSSTTVSCKINMLLADYPNKSIFGLLTGSASVEASGSASSLALAGEDCVSKLVENLIATKIVPTINSKVGTPPPPSTSSKVGKTP
ncbi:MAG TPA: HEAT repeat domain-containing protein [Kofleriaceae bacterium]